MCKVQCLKGSLDQASNGDGRFKIDWHAVQCQVGQSSFVYGMSGSNPYYVKLQVANTRVPVAAVSIMTQGQADYAVMQPTKDNAWLLFSGVPVVFPASLMITSVLGDVVMDNLTTTNLQGPPVQGSAQFPHHPELECVGGSPATTTPPTCGDFCSSPYVERPQPVAPSAGAQSALQLTNVTTLMMNNCTRSIPEDSQCGGDEGGCVDCVDGPWPGACCSSGYSCDRKDSSFWACTEIPSPRLPFNIEPYDQCGGVSSCANSTGSAQVTGLPLCTDGPWADYQCTSGFTCARYGTRYWRCDTVPGKFPVVSGAQTQSANPVTVGVASTCSAV